MTSQETSDQLKGIASAKDFDARAAELAEAWSSAGAGLETVEPILMFIEEHPAIDFGMPGALVHFVERFYGKGYEERLVESVNRKPTFHTVWMLNRVINGTKAPELRQRLIETMQSARLNPLADPNVVDHVNRFLNRLCPG
jgi:hypothetical protein